MGSISPLKKVPILLRFTSKKRKNPIKMPDLEGYPLVKCKDDAFTICLVKKLMHLNNTNNCIVPKKLFSQFRGDFAIHFHFSLSLLTT